VINGILLLDKPLKLSSNAALQKTRRMLGASKAGHVGSLDPLASGMLPICLGEATKIAGDILSGRKLYRFTGLLMVSRFRYFSFKAWPRGDKVPFVAIPVILLVLIALAINPPVVLCAVAFTYALSGPALALWTRLRRGTHAQETPAS